MKTRLSLLACLAALLVVVVPIVGHAADAPASADGTVLAPTGEPVEGAEVIVATADLAAWPNVEPKKRQEHRRGAGTTTTDKQGRFTIKLPKDAGLLCIHHPKVGYAEVKPGEDLKVKLEPWCRVEGVLRVGAKPAPVGTKVSLGSFGWGANAARVHYAYSTTTDADGRYVLDRVPKGLVKIDTKVSKTGAPLEQYTSAAPDKPTRFDIGGAGRPVIGKIVLPEGLDLKRLNQWTGIDSLTHFRRDAPWPSDAHQEGNASGQEREDAVREWRRTPAAIEAYKDEYRCEIDPQPDGTFRLDDVPPGKYVLSISFYKLEKGTSSEEAAAKKVEVVVPELPAPTDEPLDLGEIELGKEGL
jgi:hypothetical protein